MERLKGIHFDVVLDVTAYDEKDITDLIQALDSYDQYIMISSSAVYPESNVQPFAEESQLGENIYWNKYGTDKIEAERKLLDLVPNAYIIRPPYLYGPMNNVYREAFVFECAQLDRPFYLPKDGAMKLQFFHVKDLCRIIEKIIEIKTENHIFNVGNQESISIKDWVTLCYHCVGKEPIFINVSDNIDQRNYFSFYDYEYSLCVDKQYSIMPETISLEDGLREAYEWYCNNSNEVMKKSFFEFIDKNLINH